MSLAEQLRDPAVETRLAAIAALRSRATAGADELAALAECLGHDRKAVQRPAAEAFVALAADGVEVRPALERSLASSAPRERWGAAFALARLETPPGALLPVLLETLGGDDGDLRWAAADILRGLADREAVRAALRRSVRAANPVQRKMALYCLRDLDDRAPEVEAAALAMVADPDPGVRLAAIASLARLATDRPAAAARLVGVLEGDDAPTARAAAAALGTLGEGSPPVLDALRRAAAAPDAALRRAATRALRLLGGTGA